MSLGEFSSPSPEAGRGGVLLLCTATWPRGHDLVKSGSFRNTFPVRSLARANVDDVSC